MTVVTRQQQIDRLDFEFSFEAHSAAIEDREPDYEFLADRLNRALALIAVRDGRSNDIVIMEPCRE